MNANMEKMIEIIKFNNNKYEVINDNLMILGMQSNNKNIALLVKFPAVMCGPFQYITLNTIKLISIPENKKPEMYRICEELNQLYADVTVFVAENTIEIKMNAIVSTENFESELKDEIGTLCMCIDDAINRIMSKLN